MWASTQNEQQEEARANALIDTLDRQIEDLTEACEPIIAWDGICGLVQVRDEEVAKAVRAPEGKSGGNLAPPPPPS